MPGYDERASSDDTIGPIWTDPETARTLKRPMPIPLREQRATSATPQEAGTA